MSQAGFEKKVQIKTTSGSTWIDTLSNSATFTFGAELLDDTDFTSTGLRSRIRGLRDFSVNYTSNYSSTHQSISVIRTALLNGTALDVRYLPNGTKGFQGQYVVESMNHSGDVGGLETIDITLQADGILTTV
jgi:predicted secreted protein